MTINGIGSGVFGTKVQKAVDQKERPGGNAATGESARVVGDRVEISDAGRDLAAELSPDLEQIRSKVLEGEYNKPAVIEQVARRILASGDLGQD